MKVEWQDNDLGYECEDCGAYLGHCYGWPSPHECGPEAVAKGNEDRKRYNEYLGWPNESAD